MNNRRLHTDDDNQKNRWNMLFLIGIFINIYLLLSFLFGEMGHFNAAKIRHVYQKVQAEVVSLETENQDLARRIEALQHDDATIEQIARLRLGLVKPGELVYEFFETESP